MPFISVCGRRRLILTESRDPLRSAGADGGIDFADPDNLGLQGCLLDAIQETDPMDAALE